VVLYGCETWSLTIREEYRLRVFENRVLRRIFGPTADGVTEDWRKLHNEELHNLYSSPNIIRMMKSRSMRLAGHVARIGATRNAYRILVGKPEGKRPSPMGRCVGNRPTKMDLREIGWVDMGWIALLQGRNQWRALVNTVMNIFVPSISGKYLTGGYTRGLSSMKLVRSGT
jgi:hypothetical protein